MIPIEDMMIMVMVVVVWKRKTEKGKEKKRAKDKAQEDEGEDEGGGGERRFETTTTRGSRGKTRGSRGKVHVTPSLTSLSLSPSLFFLQLISWTSTIVPLRLYIFVFLAGVYRLSKTDSPL